MKKTDKYHLTKDGTVLIETASSLHDIGKIAIPNEIFATKSSGEFKKGKRHKRNPSFISLTFLFCFDIIYGIIFNLGQKSRKPFQISCLVKL